MHKHNQIYHLKDIVRYFSAFTHQCSRFSLPGDQKNLVTHQICVAQFSDCFASTVEVPDRSTSPDPLLSPQSFSTQPGLHPVHTNARKLHLKTMTNTFTYDCQVLSLLTHSESCGEASPLFMLLAIVQPSPQAKQPLQTALKNEVKGPSDMKILIANLTDCNGNFDRFTIYFQFLVLDSCSKHIMKET